MVCLKCGNQLPEGTRFCNKCGAELAADSRQQMQNAVPPETPVSKKEFVSGLGSLKVKKVAMIALITCAVSVLLLFLGLNNGINGEITDVPFWVFLTEINEVDLDRVDELAEDAVDTAERMVEYGERYDCDEDDLEKLEKCIKKLNKKMSAANFLALYHKIDELNDSSDNEDGIKSLSIVVGMDCVLFFLPLLFAVLAGLLRSRGLTIACLILMIPAQLVFGSVVLLILTGVTLIVQIVMLSKINAAYKQYCLTGIVN